MFRIFKSIVLVVVFTVISNGQTALNFVDNTSPKTTLKCSEILDSILIIGGLTQTQTCDIPSLRFYNLKSDLSVDSFLIQELYLPCEAIDVQSQNSFYAIGSPPVGDIIGDEQLVLTLVEDVLNPVDTIYFPIEYDYPGIVIKSLDVFEKMAVLAYDDFIVVLDLEIKSVTIHETANKDLLYAYWRDDSNLKLISKNGLINYNIFSKSEELISEMSINDFACFQDTFFIVKDEIVVELDKDFNTRYTWFIPNVKEVDVTENYVLFLNEGMNSEVSKFDRRDSSIIISDEFSKEQLMGYDLEANDDVFFIGRTEYEQISVLNSFNTLPDMSIDTFFFSNVTREFGYGYNFDVTVKVKNNTDIEVNSYSIFALFDAGFNCSRSYIHNTVSDKVILSNEEDVFTTSISSTYKDGDICFELFAVNNTQDQDLSGNRLCLPFDILVAVDELKEENLYQVIQNQDNLKIHSVDNNEKFVSLIGIDGKVYKRNYFTTDIEITKPENGFFILKINNGENQFSRKISWF